MAFDTRKFIAAFAALVMVLVLLGGCAHEEPQVYRVGVLCGLDFISGIADSFKEEMTSLGYVEGEDIVYDVQRTNFEPEREEEILEGFVSEGVDVIVTFPTEASMAAKAAVEGTDVPVVFTFANTEGTGLVESVQRPGGHVTGVRYPGPDIAIKRFEIMQELAPDAKRLWIPYQRGYPIVESQLAIMRPTAEKAGVTLIEFPADDAAEVQAELDRRASSDDIGIDGVLFIVEPLAVTVDVHNAIVSFGEEHRIPVGGIIVLVEGHNVLFSVNVDIPSVGRQTAHVVDKVLGGTDAGAIPVMSAESFLEIDHLAAQKLGLDVSESLLAAADNIIR